MRTPTDGEQLPKGMRLPASKVEEMLPPQGLTQVEINYSKILREALEDIDEVEIQIIRMVSKEVIGSDPIVKLELVIKPKE